MINKLLIQIDRIPMYRVVLYCLVGLSVYSLLLNTFGFLDFNIIYSSATLLTFVITGLMFNFLVSRFLKIKSNKESSLITSLILFFIFSPILNFSELPLIIAVSLIAQFSKYLFTLNKTHLFNPVAISAFISASVLQYPATWWVASLPLFIPNLIIFLIIVRKMRKFTLTSTFLITSFIGSLIANFSYVSSFYNFVYQFLVFFPFIFFAGVMLTEPFTLPASKKGEYIYALIVGLLSSLEYSFAIFYTSPELALIIANLFSFFYYKKQRYNLTLQSKKIIGDNIYEFNFKSNKKINFIAGQYMEWMLSHKSDNRGVRRYFTIASSPNDNLVKLIIKYTNEGSSYKDALVKLQTEESMYVNNVMGNFILKDSVKDYVLIAGGIGITPFISIISYLVEKNIKLNITLFYIASSPSSFIYKDLFKKAENNGVKTIYILSGVDADKFSWNGVRGNVDINLVKDNCNFTKSYFYISGPNLMVENYKNMLIKGGVEREKIVKDYFNGF